MGRYALTDFDYSLPEGLIATHPATPRDAAKLLAWPSKNSFIFSDITNFLHAGDVLVINNSKVIPARLHASRPRMEGDGCINFEILLHRATADPLTWEIFAKPGKRLKNGDTLNFADGVTGLVQKQENSVILVTFQVNEVDFMPFLHRHGEMPLPPYINRSAETEDESDYQTVYADPQGSVAAPTAGLHFTDSLLEQLKTRGVIIAPVTLHVGAGTFQPVKTENLDEHVMHHEWGEVSAKTAAIINAAKADGKRVTAVGTTSLRLLESAAKNGQLQPWAGDTDIFIQPGFDFQIVDQLITNFHLPKSTLLMLVAAFMGFTEMHAMYAHAITEKMRFYSYGDACLLTKKDLS